MSEDNPDIRAVSEYDEGFQAGADAARRECAGIAEKFLVDIHKAALLVTLRAQHATAESIARAILERVSQPVQNDQGG